MLIDDITRLRDLRKEAEYLAKRVAELEATVGISVGSGGGGSGGVPGDPVGRQAVALADLRALYDAALAQVAEAIVAAEKHIAEIPDARLRMALRYKYCDGLSWRQTAMRMDKRVDTADSLRKAVRRFFDAQQ